MEASGKEGNGGTGGGQHGRMKRIWRAVRMESCFSGGGGHPETSAAGFSRVGNREGRFRGARDGRARAEATVWKDEGCKCARGWRLPQGRQKSRRGGLHLCFPPHSSSRTVMGPFGCCLSVPQRNGASIFPVMRQRRGVLTWEIGGDIPAGTMAMYNPFFPKPARDGPFAAPFCLTKGDDGDII